MPFSAELGMNVWDPHESQRAAQPLAETAARAFEKGMSRADKARQILKRNMAMEAMKIRTQELYSHMDQSPENFALAQRQAFLENAGGIFGENENAGSVLERLMASDEATQVRRQAQSALQQRQEESLDLRRQIAEQNSATKAKDQELNLLKITQGAQEKALDRELRQTQEQRRAEQGAAKQDIEKLKEQGRMERDAANRALKAAKDTEVQRIDTDLKAAHQALQDKLSHPRWHWLTDEAGLRKAISDLEAQKAKRLKELGVSGVAETATEPDDAGTPIAKRLRWTGTGFEEAK